MRKIQYLEFQRFSSKKRLALPMKCRIFIVSGCGVKAHRVTRYPDALRPVFYFSDNVRFSTFKQKKLDSPHKICDI